MLAPLARERAHVSSFIEHSSNVAEATAERRDDLEADIERLPRFLQELRADDAPLGELSDQATPVFADLGAQAPNINRMIRELGPFSEAGIPAVESLGDASVIGTPAMRDLLPITKDLRRFAKVAGRSARPPRRCSSRSSAAAASSALLDYAFYQVAAINGFDSFGHYLRARLILNTCSRYYTAPVDGCSARFAASAQASSSASAASAADSDPILRRTAAALQGKDPDSVAPAAGDDGDAAAPEATPEARQPKAAPAQARRPPPAAAADARPAAAPQQTENVNQGEAVLDYLFGKDAAVRGRGSSIAGNPVLIGAATVLVIIVAMFLSYNANAGLPFVPSYQLKLEAPSAADARQGQRGADRRHARRRGRLDHHQAPRGRHERRGDRPQARARRRPAAQGLDGDHPAEVGARPQVRRDHARHVRRRLRGRRHDPALGVEARPRSSSTSS